MSEKLEGYLMEGVRSLNNFVDTDGLEIPLDPILSDEELVEEWNRIYEQVGYRHPDLRDKWEKEYIRDYYPDDDESLDSGVGKLEIPDFLKKKKVDLEGFG